MSTLSRRSSKIKSNHFVAKRPVTLLLALVLGVAAVGYTLAFLNTTMETVKSMDTTSLKESLRAAGITVSATLMLPHLLVVAMATLFCLTGWLLKQKWAAITAGVFFTLSLVLMLPKFYLVFPQMVLCFVGAADLGRQHVEQMIEQKLAER